MERKKKIKWGDQLVEVTEISFQTSGEHWNEYLLEDGAVIRLKTVTSEIVRLDEKYDADGNPMYVIKSSNIVAVSAPEKLRRFPEGE